MGRTWLPIGAFVLAALTLVGGLGSLALVQPDEGRNAQVAWEMQDSGSWLVPTLNQLPYLDKPAFFFKLVGISLSLFGRTETAARLPSALLALALAAATFVLVRKRGGTRCAALSVLVLATLPLYVAFARIVIFDMMLTAFVCLSIFAGHLAESSEGPAQRRWYLAGAFFAGLAFLVKGPVGFAVPALVHFAAAGFERRKGVLRRALAPANVAVFLAVALPWLVALALAVPDFLYYGVVVETLDRLVNPSFRRNQPIYFYFSVLGTGCLPWSLLFPAGAFAAFRARARLSSLDRLCIVWTVALVVVFSFSRSKQPAYVLSVCVPLAILTGRFLEAALTHEGGVAARWVWRSLLLFGGITGLGTGAVLALRADPSLLALLPDHDGPAASLWIPALPGIAIGCAAFTLAALAARLSRRVAAAVACLALLLPALLLPSLPALAAYADARSSRVLAAQIPPLPPGTEVACLKCFPSALPFYLGKPVTLVSDDASELRSNYVLFSLPRRSDRPERLVRSNELAAWLASRTGPVYLLASDDMRQALDAIASDRGVGVTKLAPERWGVLLQPPAGS